MGISTMFLRITVAVLAYFLSSGGLLLMCQLISEELQKSNGRHGLIFVWITAWLTHAVMTVAWIRHKPLPRFWPVAGTVAGIASLMVWPFLTAQHIDVVGLDSATFTAGVLMAVQLVLVAPCMLLAFWLVYFHCKGRQRAAIASATDHRTDGAQ